MYDLAVIGLGPAGLEAVEVAVKNNLKVVAFEEKELGGTCLNVGCIPTKSLIHCAKLFNEISNASKLGINVAELPDFNFSKMLERKDDIVSKFTKTLNSSLLKNVTLIKSRAELYIDNDEPLIICDDNIYKAKNIIVSTGSKSIELPDLKFDSKFVLSSDDLFNLNKIPNSITIVGSGAIGLEWAQIFAFLGSKVTIVEKAPVLAPSLDCDLQKRIERILKVNNIDFYKGDYIVSANNHEITLNSGKKINSDIILVAVGRKANLPKVSVLGCSEDFKLNIIDNFKTEFENLYIIGDATSGVMLAHNASYQAKCLMNKILNNEDFEYRAIPSVIYLTPEIASCGVCEQAVKNDSEYTVSKIMLASIAKSWCDEAQDGFIKLIIKDNAIKGAHLVCPEASSLITLLSYFIDNCVSLDEIKKMIFPHPSYSELILRAVKNVK